MGGAHLDVSAYPSLKQEDISIVAIMAIYHFTTSIVKASSGKCAVASSAYISGTSLYDERLGMEFSYKTKDEVVHTEILLPKYAPPEYQDRHTLWNEVEKVQNKSNSRYARQFEFAVPNEWSREEAIERSREFIQKAFVDRGMAVEFAYHEKEGNHHIHCMCTVRGFKPDGKWESMEKKVIATDKDGNRIPQIDPKTGEQKVRVRPGKGTEKIWKYTTVKANDWNKRSTLLEWRKDWSEHCNKYLDKEDHIDHRSYEEQGNGLIPTIHEGYSARQIERDGGISEKCEINREIRETNSILLKLREEVKQLAKDIIRKVGDLLGRITRSSSTDEAPVRATEVSRTTAEDNRETGVREQIPDLQTLIIKSEQVIADATILIDEEVTDSGRGTITGTESHDSGDRIEDTSGTELSPDGEELILDGGIDIIIQSFGSALAIEEDEIDGIRELSIEIFDSSIEQELRAVNDRVEQLTKEVGEPDSEAESSDRGQDSIAEDSTDITGESDGEDDSEVPDEHFTSGFDISL